MPISAGELAELLRDDCEALFRELIPNAHVDGGELAGHMPDGGKVKMAVRGPKRGQWLNCHNPDQRGDPLDLITWCECAGDTRRSFAWACQYLRIDHVTSTTWKTSVPAAIEETSKHLSVAPRSSNPLGLYLKGLMDREEIVSYLQGRLLVPAEQLPIARCLRFLPRCLHTETDTWPPAMLAPVIHLVTRQHIATHRTWLMCDRGIWRNAPVAPKKKSLGAYGGGIIPLLNGASGRPFSEAPDGEMVTIAEGIENALAAAYLMRAEAPRVWAGVSVTNLPNVARAMPGQFTRVVIVKDNNPGNIGVAKTLSETVDLLIDQGRTVEFLSAPTRYKDVAEFLSHEGPIARRESL